MDGQKQMLYEGRVEICHQKYWKSICPSGWSDLDAMVTCRQLGFTVIGKTIKVIKMLRFDYAGAGTTSNKFGLGPWPANFSDFSCPGSEDSLLKCSHTQTSCSDRYHAGVKCEGIPSMLVSLYCQYAPFT